MNVSWFLNLRSGEFVKTRTICGTDWTLVNPCEPGLLLNNVFLKTVAQCVYKIEPNGFVFFPNEFFKCRKLNLPLPKDQHLSGVSLFCKSFQPSFRAYVLELVSTFFCKDETLKEEFSGLCCFLANALLRACYENGIERFRIASKCILNISSLNCSNDAREAEQMIFSLKTIEDVPRCFALFDTFSNVTSLEMCFNGAGEHRNVAKQIVHPFTECLEKVIPRLKNLRLELMRGDWTVLFDSIGLYISSNACCLESLFIQTTYLSKSLFLNQGLAKNRSLVSFTHLFIATIDFVGVVYDEIYRRQRTIKPSLERNFNLIDGNISECDNLNYSSVYHQILLRNQMLHASNNDFVVDCLKDLCFSFLFLPPYVIVEVFDWLPAPCKVLKGGIVLHLLDKNMSVMHMANHAKKVQIVYKMMELINRK